MKPSELYKPEAGHNRCVPAQSSGATGSQSPQTAAADAASFPAHLLVTARSVPRRPRGPGARANPTAKGCSSRAVPQSGGRAALRRRPGAGDPGLPLVLSNRGKLWRRGPQSAVSGREACRHRRGRRPGQARSGRRVRERRRACGEREARPKARQLLFSQRFERRIAKISDTEKWWTGSTAINIYAAGAAAGSGRSEQPPRGPAVHRCGARPRRFCAAAPPTPHLPHPLRTGPVAFGSRASLARDPCERCPGRGEGRHTHTHTHRSFFVQHES